MQRTAYTRPRLQAPAGAWAAFKTLHAEEAAWIETNRVTNEFADSMYYNIQQYGRLTENMMNAVRRATENSRNRQQHTQLTAATAPAVNDDGLKQVTAAFATAFSRGLRTPKMRVGLFTLSRAPDHGQNAGAIYVKQDEQYLGKILNSRFIKVRDCTAEQEQQVLEATADPKAAAIAYGRRTGNCSICGRTLTNGESIDQGIGPICADKFGW